MRYVPEMRLIVAWTAPGVKNEVITALFSMVRDLRGPGPRRRRQPQLRAGNAVGTVAQVTLRVVSLGAFWSCGGKPDICLAQAFTDPNRHGGD
jgi:hypothetical protein